MSNSTPFTIPSQAGEVSEEELALKGELFDGLGRRKIITPEAVGEEKPKRLGYTRATTFIKALDETTALEKWRQRLVLQGAPLVGMDFRVRALIEGVDQEDKQEAKELRAELDDLAEEAFYAAGGRDKADYGTALHDLIERFHAETLTVNDIIQQEEAWPGIGDDLEAYEQAYAEFAEATGSKVLMLEVLLVDDKLKIAGRTDLVALAKLPGDKRARRIIIDYKTGKIDNGLRLSQQLALYAGSKLYDPETGIRTNSRIRQDVAIIVHIPKGEATATFHVVDLAPGRAANLLCLKVRASRRKVPGIMWELGGADE